MKNGIERNKMGSEVDDLTNNNLLTMSRTEARKLLNYPLPDWAEELAATLDEAQGAEREQDRYVVIYVEKE